MSTLKAIRTVQYYETWEVTKETVLSMFRRDTDLSDIDFYKLVHALFDIKKPNNQYIVLRANDYCKVSVYCTTGDKLRNIDNQKPIWSGTVDRSTLHQWFKDQDMIQFNIVVANDNVRKVENIPTVVAV